MLDDLKVINDRDPSDTLGIAERQWQQLSYDFNFKVEPFEAKNIVYSGMGGSSLAALLSETWPGYDVPFHVVRNYDIPSFVNQDTLFIACSYSGNTEETLSSIEQAKAKGARICVIAGGGKLTEFAENNGYPVLVLPKAEQPRYAVLYNLKALVAILDGYGILKDDDLQKELSETEEFLKTVSQRWRATVPTAQNLAKQIAHEAIGKSAVIYAGPNLAPAAYKWKISFNENAKQVAWWNQYPEFNHNEFMGWTEQPTIKPYCVIDLRSNLDHPRIQKRFEVTSRLLSGKRPDPIVVNAEGDTVLAQLLFIVMLGDFVTIYTGLLNGVNPAPVVLIEKFKKELDL